MGKAVNSNRITVVQQKVLGLIVSEVIILNSCFPRAKAIQSRVRKKNNCLVLVKKKSSSSRIPDGTGIVYSESKVSDQYKTWTTDWV